MRLSTINNDIAILQTILLRNKIRKNIQQQQQLTCSPPENQSDVPLYEDVKNINLLVPPRTIEFTQCPVYDSIPKETNLSIMHENEQINICHEKEPSDINI